MLSASTLLRPSPVGPWDAWMFLASLGTTVVLPLPELSPLFLAAGWAFVLSHQERILYPFLFSGLMGLLLFPVPSAITCGLLALWLIAQIRSKYPSIVYYICAIAIVAIILVLGSKMAVLLFLGSAWTWLVANATERRRVRVALLFDLLISLLFFLSFVPV